MRYADLEPLASKFSGEESRDIKVWPWSLVHAIDLKYYVTGTPQPKEYQAKMHGIPIALSSRGEQQRIVAKTEELMTWCDRLEAQLATIRTEATR